MSETYRITVSKDYLAFASAHFVTLKGHQCEALHGHNYRVAVTLEGAIDAECLFVLDFAIVKQIARALVDELDHRVLLPTGNPKMVVRDEGARVAVEVFGEPRYIFPRRDCALLPIANSTAEMLAGHLASRFRTALADRGVSHLTGLEVEVEESPGQSAAFRLALP